MAGAGQQRGGRLFAGQLHPTGQGEVEVRRDPQHVGLAAGFQVLAQLGAAAIHLIAAHVVQLEAISEGLGEQVDGQLALGPEHQTWRQPYGQGPGRVFNVLTRDPLPGAD